MFIKMKICFGVHFDPLNFDPHLVSQKLPSNVLYSSIYVKVFKV